MSDLNSVCLVGRLVRDVEVRYTQNNVAHSIFSIAVDRSVKHGEQWQSETSFIDIEAWGNLAENIKKYSGKGKRVAVNGYLVQKKWQGKDGSNKSKICVTANSINAIDRVQQDSQGYQPVVQQSMQRPVQQQSMQQPMQQPMQQQQVQQPMQQPVQEQFTEDFIEDIPF